MRADEHGQLAARGTPLLISSKVNTSAAVRRLLAAIDIIYGEKEKVDLGKADAHA
jgi:hypothetical protein